MKLCVRIAIIATVILLLPHFGFAQGGFAGRIRSLHEVLDQLYDDMMPLCSRLIGVGRGVAVAVGVAVAAAVAVAVGVGVGLEVGVGVGVPPCTGARMATVIGSPVLKKSTVAFATCGG